MRTDAKARAREFLLALLFVPAFALASEAMRLQRLDEAPDLGGDRVALSNGARIFADYCLGCHGLGFIRYSRLLELGLTERQIRSGFLAGTEKIGDSLRVAAGASEMKQWFGVAPADLSQVARARTSVEGKGGNWLYTYLRSFHRDENRPGGWNNALYPNTGMPHVFWEEQGEREWDARAGALFLARPGRLTPAEFDRRMAELTGFLVWAGEPAVAVRKQLGVGVLVFLAILSGVAYALKREYWKDIGKN